MDIRILGWKSKGLRCPDVDISFISKKNQPAQVSFVQMPNGTGKTTTLSFLTAALTGNAIENPIEFLEKSSDSDGLFILKVSINEDWYDFEIVIDRFRNQCNFFTTSKKMSRVSGWRPLISAKSFLTKDFIKLFVFDGEYANDLLDKNKSTAKKAIDTLCQLNILDLSDKYLKDYLNGMRTEGKTASKSSLTLAKTALDNIKQFREKRQTEKTNKIKELNEIVTKIEYCDSIINAAQDENEKFSKAKNEAINKLNDKQSEIEETTRNIYQLISNPYLVNKNLQAEIDNFKNHLDRLKLPEDAAKQFFIELSESTHCVCGTKITEAEKINIINNSENYLDDETSSLLNILKGNIDNASIDNENDLSEVHSNLGDLIVEKDEAQLDLNSLELSFQGDNKTYQDAIQNKGKYENQKEIIDSQLKEYDENKNNISPTISLENIKSIEYLQELERSKESEITELTNTVSLRNKVDLLGKVFSLAKTKSREELTKELLITCRDKIQKTLTENPIEIEDISDYIKLRGQSRGSVGQNLSLAYIFLTASLAQNESNSFPLVVDSPSGPLDDVVRKNLASDIPKLTKQFITFIISTEKADFAEPIEEACHGNVTFHTIFNNSNKTQKFLESFNGDKSKIISSPDGSTTAYGRDFFYSFHLADK